MKELQLWLSLSILSVLLTGCVSEGNKKLPDEMKMSKDVFADKIKGGWAGKTIGCPSGGPVEFIHNGTFINDDTPIKWTKDRVKYYFETFLGLYDDIYVNIIFINVFDRLGLNAPVDSFADTQFPLWHANQVARYNIKNGIVQKGYVSCTDPNYIAEIEVSIDNKLVEQAKLPAASSNQVDDRRVDLFYKYQLENTTHAIKYRWLNPTGIAHIYLKITEVLINSLNIY